MWAANVVGVCTAASLVVVFVSGATVFSTALKTCQSQCEDRLLAYPLQRAELAWTALANCTGDKCISSCKKGCSDLDERESKCSTTCFDGDVAPNSCQQGCRAALISFLSLAQGILLQSHGNMEPLEDVMLLKWEFPETVAQELQETAAADVFWFAQTRPLHGKLGWRWTSLPAGSFRNSTLTAEVKVPYEKTSNIEIRLALSYRSEVLVAKPLTYQLPANKVGCSFVEVTGQVQLSNDKLAMCYKADGIVVKYKLQLLTLDGNTLSTVETNYGCHLFTNLLKENCCRVTIQVLDQSGEVAAETNTHLHFFVNTVDAELMSSADAQIRLVFSNGSHLLLAGDFDQYLLSEASAVSFPLPADDSITALAGITENSVVIGTSKGSLWVLHMSNNATEESNPASSVPLLPAGKEDGKVSHIEIDHAQCRAYAVIYDRGVVRCKLRSNAEEPPECVFLTNNDPLNPVRQISIDAVNGFIYMLNADHKVYQIEMFAFNATEEQTITGSRVLPDLCPSNGIFFDSDRFVLLSALKNGTILEMNAVTEEVRTFRAANFADVSLIRVKANRLFWAKEKCGEAPIDETCVYSENSNRDESPPSRYLHPSALGDFAFLEETLMRPRFVAVDEVGVVVSDRRARVTWNPARNLPFQAQGKLWRNVSYGLTFTPTELPETLPTRLNTESNDVTLDVIANAEYKAEVRVCSGEFCSAAAETTNTAFGDFSGVLPYVFVKAGFNGGFDPLGFETSIDQTVTDLKKFSGPLGFDNTTGLVYVTGENSIGVYRRDVSETSVGEMKSFLDGIAADYLAVLPAHAIVVVGSSYHVVAYRLTGTFDHEYYTCIEPLEDCAEVIGISSSDSSGEVYFLTQARNGSVFLWEANQADRTPQLVSSAHGLPSIKQFHMAGEKVVIVTTDGRIAQADRHLKPLNFVFTSERVDAVVPICPAAARNNFAITGDVRFVENSRSQLVWNVEPDQASGKILFKVMVFREKMGVEQPLVSVQTENTYTIPADVLSQWSSAQRFDVSLQVLSPWMSIVQNRTGLLAPVKPPTTPTEARIYATQQKTVDGPRALISFFWSPPAEWNGTPYQYVVNCTKDDGNAIGESIVVSSSMTHYYFAVKSGKVGCQVAAANEPANVGAFSEAVSVDSSELKPLVKLFAIDSTNSLVAITNVTHDEPRRERRQVAQPTKLDYQAIAFIGDDLFAVRKEGDSAQPLLVQIDTNDIDNNVHKVSIGGDVTKIEAMTSDWVGNRLLFVSGTALYQLSLEPFLSTSLLNPHKLIQLSVGASDAKQLTFDPFKNTAYLLTRNGSLFSLDLNEQVEANLALTVSCLTSQTVTWMMTEFAWNRAASPKIYALTWNGLISVDLAEENSCNEVRIDWAKFGEKGLKLISSFAIADKLFVFVTSSEMLFYGRNTVTPIPITNPPLKQILAVSQSSQPYPDRACFELPSSKGIQFTIINEGKTGALLEVAKSTSAPACQRVSMPQTQYEVYFTRKNTDKVKHVRSFSDKIHVENGILDKETDYDVTVAWLNRYSPASGISTSSPFRTGFGYPSAPREPHAISVTPDTVYIYWSLPETLNAPISEIKYKASQQAAGLALPASIAVIPLAEAGSNSTATADFASCLVSPCRVKVANLRPSNDYKFWITAMHVLHLNATFLQDSDAVSPEAIARTLDVPGTLRPDNVTGSSVLLRWNGLQPEQPPTSISVQYRETGENNEWTAPSNASFDPSVSTILLLINNLLSATSYDYRFVAAYTGTYIVEGKVLAYKEDYYQGVQQIRTKAGVPASPVSVESRMDDEGWIVEWKQPMSDGGSPITSYAVEMRINKTAEWEIAERGLDGWKLWWRPSKTDNPQIDLQWEFRVRAANVEGFGAYAYSEPHGAQKASESESGLLLYALILCILLLLIALLFLICFILRARRAAEEKKRQAEDDRHGISLEHMTALPVSPHHPLPSEISNELKNLPHVNKSDVQMLDVISVGTYGDVYRGIASNVPVVWEKQVNVAVKTLRLNHTYHEKMTFMKEAILLNNIDHPNIIKMLGVCMARETEFIMMELMEDGDLLSFLKASVPTEAHPSDLSLRDLLAMATDVARGMSHLERLPHVHRDVAARNCLINNCKSSSIRVTKINVSLARGMNIAQDLRLHPESCFQARWLAPEVLKDLSFSSKSDVWSFGILLYEIFSLGAVPFHDLDVKEMITLVRSGGTLKHKPSYCPERLFKLISQCCSLDPQKRPKFSQILKIFEALREKLEFQDDKPLQVQDHFNANFDASHDSTSSERIDSHKDSSLGAHLARSFGGFENTFESEKPIVGSIVAAPKSAKPSVVRSLRKERKQRNPMPTMEDLDVRAQSVMLPRPLSIHSTDTVSTDYGGGASSSSLPSPTFNVQHPRQPVMFNLPSTLQLSTASSAPYEIPKSRINAAPAVEGVDNEGYETPNSGVSLSRSWNASGDSPLASGVSNANQLSLHAPSHSRPASLSATASRTRPASAAGTTSTTATTTTSSGAYDPRRSRVSQV